MLANLNSFYNIKQYTNYPWIDECRRRRNLSSMTETTYRYHQHHRTNIVSSHDGSTINHRMFNHNRKEGHTRFIMITFWVLQHIRRNFFVKDFGCVDHYFYVFKKQLQFMTIILIKRNDVVRVRGFSYL